MLGSVGLNTWLVLMGKSRRGGLRLFEPVPT